MAGRSTKAAALAAGLTVLAVGLTALPGARAVQAQEGSATLRGIVFDSTTMSVLAGARVAESEGHKVEFLRVTETGLPDLEHLEALLSQSAALRIRAYFLVK